MVANQEEFHKLMGGGKVLELTLSLDAVGGAYAAGDVLAEVQELANAGNGMAVCGVIHSIEAIDLDDQGQPFDLVFFDMEVDLGTENAAISISDADAAHLVAAVRMEFTQGNYVDLGGSQAAYKENLGKQFECAAGVTSLWVGAISRGTGTYTASGIQLKIGVWYGL